MVYITIRQKLLHLYKTRLDGVSLSDIQQQQALFEQHLLLRFFTSQAVINTIEKTDIKNNIQLEQFLIRILNSYHDFAASEHKTINPKYKKQEWVSGFELASIIHLILPIVKLQLTTSETQKPFLARYHFFDKNEGIYTTDAHDYVTQLIWSNNIVKSRRYADDVLIYISSLADMVSETIDSSKIIVNNGIFDSKLKQLLPFTPDFISLSKLSTDYIASRQNPIIQNENGTTWDVDTWLSDLASSPDVNTLFWQVIRAAIQPGYIMSKAIFFYSSQGNNGKGTFGQLIKNLVGKTNYSSLPIKAYGHEFMKSKLIGKVVNIADENPVDQYIDDVHDFKAAITGDDILVNIKGKTPISMQCKMLNIQMLNGLPKTRDKTDSFYRRLIVVPFTKSFTDNGENTAIKTDYIHRKEVLEYVLATALNMLDFSEFIVPLESQKALNGYREENNPIIEFWNEINPQLKWEVIPRKFLYKLYLSWYSDKTATGRSDDTFKEGQFYRLFGDILRNYNKTETSQSSMWVLSFQPEDYGPIKTLNYMDADEPLITEYQISSYYNDKTTSTFDKKKLRQFTRPTTVRGLVKASVMASFPQTPKRDAVLNYFIPEPKTP